MRSAATNPAASPIPPAHTRGTPRSPSSFTSCSALFGPACPPARWFTAIRPRTPESSPFSAHFRSVTSWYTRPPTWATRSTTHRGLPNDVIKNRTPSSIASSTERRMRSRYSREDCSIRTFMPIGFAVSRRMSRSPSRSSCPCTYTIDRGWTIPMPPASDTAATSSGFEHGNMAPPISGTATRASRVSAVSSPPPPPPPPPPPRSPRGCRGGPDSPADRRASDHPAGGVRDHGLEVVFRLATRVGDRAAGFRRERAAGLLQVGDGKRGGDAAGSRRQTDRHREATRHLGEIRERDGVDGAEVVTHGAAVGHADLGIAGAELQHVWPHRDRKS